MIQKSNALLKGVLLVGFGAASYGVLATMVRLGYDEGYSTGEIVFSQYLIGLIILGIILLLGKNKQTEAIPQKATKKSLIQLLLVGTSMGFTGIFYYQAIHYVPVSICIILLMQSVWLGLVFDVILTKKRPSFIAIISVLIVILGTAFATNAWEDLERLNAKGVFWGFLAALSYTTTIFAGNHVGTELKATKRSFWMMLGGFLVVLCYVFPELLGGFKWLVFVKWGVVLAIFGTVIPPLLMNKGLPITGMGLGSIISSVEIPVSVFSAFLILNETVVSLQWMGICLIILAVVFMNFPFKGKNKKTPNN